METPKGMVSVSYERMGGIVKFNIAIPEGCKASFHALSHTCELCAGENTFSVSEK
jgi:hypothetical protein